MSREVDLSELKGHPPEDLLRLAVDLGIEGAAALPRQQLIFEVLRQQSNREGGNALGRGVLEILSDGFGFLRDPAANYLPAPDDIYVSPSQIRRFNLQTGDLVVGRVRAPKDNERYFALTRVESINDRSPDAGVPTVQFDNLTPLHPDQQLRLEHDPSEHTTRLMDLFCPVGKGQRGLIVAPPRTGKTVLLQHVARALEQNHPEVTLIVLLIDERPEEVTDMRRTVRGEVVASTFDELPARHVQVAEMVLERARRLVEQRRDVVILLDSITRLARAYNNTVPASGKLLSGGVDATALHRPKRFFGAARKVEEGGSLTILGTALVDTGSRMDEVIFEEFKGTGNMELVLDRKLSNRRLFPAMDVLRSGTRKEERLLGPGTLVRVDLLRQALQGNPVADMEWLVDKLRRFPTNAELLANLQG